MRLIKPKLNSYSIIQEAIERGIRWGWQHAHKHVSDPTEEDIMERILVDIMNELAEVINFDT